MAAPTSPRAQGRYTHAASDARLQRLGGDLRAAQHDHRVDRFERNPLTPFGRRHQQRTLAVLHSGAMVANVYGAQVTHRNTTSAMYRLTFCGALVISGMQ